MDIIEILIPLVVAVIGWAVVSRKSHAETEKLEAETAGLYADMARNSAKSEKDIKTQYDKMARDSRDRENELKKQITSLESRINEMQETIESLTNKNREKDKRIIDLEKLSKEQATKIVELQTEVDALRLKRK